MFFRNLTLFVYPPALGQQFATREDVGSDSFELLAPLASEYLAACAARPVGPAELMSRGFLSPTGSDDPGSFAWHFPRIDATWIVLGGEDRVLPAAAVNRELAKRIDAIEAREGRRLGGRARKRLKEDVVAELLPRALVKPYRLNAYLDLELGVVVVDTSSRRAAENLVSELRHAIGSFPALPANAETSVRAVLTGWLSGEPMPEGLRLGEGCVLKDPIDGGAVARLANQELQVEEVQYHLRAGKQCVRLELVLDDHVAFELGEDLAIRKLRFLDAALAPLEGQEHDGLQDELDARFTLMVLQLRHLFGVLGPALKLSQAEG